jgi:hypothetical protein
MSKKFEYWKLGIGYLSEEIFDGESFFGSD